MQYVSLPSFVPHHLYVPLFLLYAVFAGARPFMITGAFSRWNISASTFSLAYFESAFPTTVTDFYPHNMPRSSSKPYLVPMKDALREMRQRTHAFPRDMYVCE